MAQPGTFYPIDRHSRTANNIAKNAQLHANANAAWFKMQQQQNAPSARKPSMFLKLFTRILGKKRVSKRRRTMKRKAY